MTELTGAGATFPYPLYVRWFADYEALSGTRITYRSIGSGAGVRELERGTADFAATEFPDSVDGAPGGAPVFPVVAGAVAITYNLPPRATALRLDGASLADIYLGRIRRWRDQRLVTLNPGAELPDTPITVVFRVDTSGSTRTFTSFLATTGRAWASGPGAGMAISWPHGVGERGNEGVAARVKQTAGAIGFVELTYVRQSRLPTAAIRNRRGEFVAPTVSAVERAVAAITDSLADGAELRASPLDVDAPGAYPITSLSWLVAPARPRTRDAQRALGGFIQWAVLHGGARAHEMDYAPLPSAVAARVARRAQRLLIARSPE